MGLWAPKSLRYFWITYFLEEIKKDSIIIMAVRKQYFLSWLKIQIKDIVLLRKSPSLKLFDSIGINWKCLHYLKYQVGMIKRKFSYINQNTWRSLKEKNKTKLHNKTSSGAQTEHFKMHSDPVVMTTNENPL